MKLELVLGGLCSVALIFGAAVAGTTDGAASAPEARISGLAVPGDGAAGQLMLAASDDLLLGDDAGSSSDSGDLLGGEESSGDLLAPGGDDDLLGGESQKGGAGDVLAVPVPEEEEGAAEAAKAGAAADHEALFLENRFPSATTCKTCHPVQFEQWAVSQHAYAQLSPVFNAMHGTVLKLTNGTNGDFCIRCHTPVGMNQGEPLFMSNMDRHPTSREGVTCITCHRIDQDYGKISGRLPIIEGDITETVYGPMGNENLKKALANPDVRVTTDPNGRGRKIHRDVGKFTYLSQPGVCGACHDVTLVNGFRLEEAFSEYKMSPAAEKGQTCQDCHMSTVPGVPSGYDFGPAANVGGVETPPRKLTNHMFVGPDHSVIHPGLFPLNENAIRTATMREWLQFDYKAGWGTDEFENQVSDDYEFPERWSSIDDRYDARAIINVQLKRLDKIATLRKELLQRAYLLGPIKVDKADSDGLRFHFKVSSGTDGHNVPTGFTGERLVFAQVTVTDNSGKVVFRSGDLDPNGDVRDSHSLYVHNGELPQDTQLFNLQSTFLTRNIRGSEKEVVLPVNFSPDPLPFLRPDPLPTVLTGRTIGARIHKKGIEPNGHRTPEYKVRGKDLTGNSPYTINVKLIAGMIPINLVAAIQDVGFDYGMSTRDIADGVLAGHQILAEENTVVDIK